MHKVDEQMNTQFVSDFNDEEIFMVVKQLHPTKAQAPMEGHQYFINVSGISLAKMFVQWSKGYVPKCPESHIYHSHSEEKVSKKYF